MKLEQQVTSLELSKKLCELGAKQESLFYWTRRTDNKKIFIKDYGVYQGKRPDNDDEFSAFTVAELGNILDFYDQQKTDKHGFNEYISKRGDIEMSDRNPANSLAKMLIYLLENNLIEL